MPRKVVRKERGVFEKVSGSGIWWIRYKVHGVTHREKVGRRGDAVDLYKLRRADIIRGAKLPANMKNKGLKFEVIGNQALDWYIEHGRTLGRLIVEMSILLRMNSGQESNRVLAEAAKDYNLNMETIAASVRKEFAAREKAKAEKKAVAKPTSAKLKKTA